MKGLTIAALDMGGTKIKSGVFRHGQLIRHTEIDSEAKQGGLHFLEQGAKLLQSMGPFDRLGISTTGQIDPQTGVIRYANDNIRNYTGVNVNEFFQTRFGKPCRVINDVYAAALAEGTYGAVRGETDYLCITYGTGIGGGVMLDGRLYYGTGASAGVMLGGLITHPEQIRRDDPFSGSYERNASASALISKAQAADPSLHNGRAIFTRIGEPPVRQLVDEWLDEVAIGLCALIHVYNIPCVVLGGGVMEQTYAIEGVRARVSAHLIPGFQGIRIIGAQMGNLAGLYGAVSLMQGNLNKE